MNQNAQLISFCLQSDAAQILLVGQKDNEEPFILNMQQSEPGFWFMRLELHPGVYRLRYYWSDGQNTIYLGAAHASYSTVDDLDALIEIRRSKIANVEQKTPLWTLPESQGSKWKAIYPR